MLRFMNKPDRVLTEVITRALEETISSAVDTLDFGDSDWDTVSHGSCEFKPVFGGDLALYKTVLEKLLEAHKSSEGIFMPTDYHFLFLDRILHSWVDCYSDMVVDIREYEIKKGEEQTFAIKNNDGVDIEKIDFNDLFNSFFWDNDYDFTVDSFREPLKRQMENDGMAPPEIDSELTDDRIREKIRGLGTADIDMCKTGVNASLRDPVDLEDLTLEQYTTNSDSEWKEVSKWWTDEDDEC